MIDTTSKATWNHWALISAYRLQSTIEGSQGRISSKNPKAGTEAEHGGMLFTGKFRAHNQLPFLYCPGPPAHNGLDTPTSISNRPTPKHAHRQLFEIPFPSVASWQPRLAILGLMGSYHVIGYVPLKEHFLLPLFPWLSCAYHRPQTTEPTNHELKPLKTSKAKESFHTSYGSWLSQIFVRMAENWLTQIC